MSDLTTAVREIRSAGVGELLGRIASLRPEQVDSVVDSARAAQRVWAAAAPHHRADALVAAASALAVVPSDRRRIAAGDEVELLPLWS